MSKNRNMELELEYAAAVEKLQKFCDENTNLEPCVVDYEYPARVEFIPDPQMSLFAAANVDESGELGHLTVTVGLTTSVKSTLKFKMDSKTLKKLIKLAERVAFLHYHDFTQRQTEHITPKRAVDWRCPSCDAVVPNPHLAPNNCHECGQALDWRPEPAPDEYEAGMEKLRDLVSEKEAEK